MRIIILGASGFIGKNLKEYLQDKHNLITPTHTELDLTKYLSVYQYFNRKKADIVIHCANADSLKDNIDMFLNIITYFKGKIIYFGSGAEYRDKTEYALSKRIMNIIALESSNIYNLRLYGVYGKYEKETRFPTTICQNVLHNRSTIIKYDINFDYLYVNDLCKIVEWFINNNPKHHDYNICTSKPKSLKSIASLLTNNIIEEHNPSEYEIYGKDNEILLKEMNIKFTPMKKGLKELYDYIRLHI